MMCAKCYAQTIDAATPMIPDGDSVEQHIFNLFQGQRAEPSAAPQHEGRINQNESASMPSPPPPVQQRKMQKESTKSQEHQLEKRAQASHQKAVDPKAALQQPIYCPQCGALNPSTINYCMQCGTKIAKKSGTAKKKPQNIQRI